MRDHEPAADRIVREALLLPDAERMAYLREACAGNPKLRQEVETLLSSVTETHSVTEVHTVGEEATHPASPDLGSLRYVVQDLIGQGGMGQVYRAYDRQLDRVVAIKAIRPGRGSAPDVMRRLAREARLAASLDHPFICKVHELIEREDGHVFFVMEFVQGETLRAVLKKAPLDLSTAVRIGREIAEALSFAHQRGVVHRDIKPANVMVTAHGHIKVMDFGVAKLLDAPEASTEATLTADRRVVGTPAYMSPEQAAGEHVDQHSDIFSFGVVLYQCLTGQLPFEGSSAPEYQRAAATAGPRPFPKRVPIELRAIAQRCLEKKPENRPPNLEAVSKELGAAAVSLLSSTSDLTFRQRVRLGPRPWVALAVLTAVAAAVAYAVIKWRQPDEGTSRLRLQRPVVTWPSVENNSRISPDGKVVAFISAQGGGPRLWVRSVDGSTPTPITPAQEALKTPAWSPDDKQIALLVRKDGQAWLQVVSVWGEIAKPTQPIGGAWDDVALVRWLGDRLYFSVASGRSSSVLWRRNIKSNSDEQVTHASEGKRFTTTGRAVDLDVRQDEGRLVFAAARPDTGVWTSDLDGRNATKLPALGSGPLHTPRWVGTDGKRIVYIATENGQPDIWEYNLSSGVKAAVTASPLEEDTVDVSTSGGTLVADTVEVVSHLWSADAGGVSPALQLTNDSRSDLWPSISPLSDRMIFHRTKGSFVEYVPADTELMAARWTGGRLEAGDVIDTGASGAISADGRRVLFLRWPKGSAELPELWVKDLGGSNPAVKLWDWFWFPGNHIETWAPLGQNAAWAPRGSDELFFVRRRSPTEQVYELVHTTLGPDLSATTQVLATDRDDQRFLDPALSDDGKSLAVIAASRRPYRGGNLQVLDPRQPGSAGDVVFTAPDGSQLFCLGWTKRNTVVLLRSFRPDVQDMTEVWEIGPNHSRRRIGVEAGLLAMTAYLDRAGDRLFATGVDHGLSSVRAIPLTGAPSKTVVANAVDGITFGGFAVTADGRLLFMRKETNYDVWIFDIGNPAGATRPNGG